MPHDARPPVQGLLTPHANFNPTTSFTALPPIPTGHLGSGVNTSEHPDSDAVWVAPVSGIIGPKTRDHMDSITCEILGKIRKSGMSFDEAGRLTEVIEADERLRRFVFRSPETEGPQGLAAEAPQAINRREWLVPVEAVIVRSLDASVVELARLYLSQPRQSDSEYLKIGDIVKGINEAITRAEESWFDEHTVTFCISKTILLRIGDYDRVDDVETLQHIQTHSTGMPIPTVLGIMRQGARLYLFLTRPEGRPLEHYYRNLTRPDGISIRKHLDRIFRALRNIPLPPPTSSQPLDFENSARLGGGNPRRCKDLRGGLKISGSPVSCEVEFNHFLCTDPWPMDVWEMHLKDRFLENHEMVLTYANLHPANIIVAPRRRPDTEDGSTLQITGILNWELAGVYPAYWEYVKALNPMARRPLPLDWWWFVPPSIGIHAKEHALYALLPVVREREDQGSWADAAAFG
ncbi:hypothetical protein FQN51_008237 [Onygenales sp. PD_10]|nr:hypothetical protein FQN51_008237 [Onygenales sp. PD_10]